MELEVAIGLIGALSGLIGAAVGGGVTLFANNQTNTDAEAQRVKDRAQYIADRQFDAHVNFLNAANEVHDDMRQLWDDIVGQHNSIAASHAKYLESWRVYFTRTAAPRLTGPAELDPSAAALREAIFAYAQKMDEWMRDLSKPASAQTATADWELQLNVLVESLTEAKNAYIKKGLVLLWA
ncbi:hypothetical protein CH275_14710 [Rhodococcus sp. 06-235-1A]|uniref:hypothetical protein n=1 Tax=Rhodococcus sp. 06-235-1A TaxID=2022508 RepID=UPI000B9C1C66|nr:hypothetical protein [Rhodococcus sp. 06-235-1A]OZD04458.1 hypothetical protein CH275_14710 [Rhodococcus sp. 06-235-1A]